MKEAHLPKDPVLGLLPIPHERGGFVVRPVDMAKVKGRAILAMEQQTDDQLERIYEQVKVLANQAQEIKKRSNVSYDIYRAEMKFEPVIGKTYHLYQRNGGSKFVSPISPEEWNSKHEHVATVTLLADHTWKVH